MALWRLEADEDLVKLTYFAGDKAPQKCGQSERSGEDALEAWVAEQMEVWDVCTLTNGATFVRQTSPAGGVRA